MKTDLYFCDLPDGAHFETKKPNGFVYEKLPAAAGYLKGGRARFVSAPDDKRACVGQTCVFNRNALVALVP